MKIPEFLGYCGDRFDNETRYSPARWMRHLLSWRILRWINDHTDVCWTNVVMWKLGYDRENWWPNRNCFHPYDYCGKFEGKPQPQIPEPVYVTFRAGEQEETQL
jgi:hypothetical protein